MGGTTEAADIQADGYYAHPVRAVPLGTPGDAHMDLIRAHVLDPAILDTNEPYVWAAQASNDREDAYGTRMHRSTLDNFAADAANGVAFMNSHRTGGYVGQAELPMGRTIEGKVVGASAANPLRVDITAYTLRGLNLTGLSTDAFIDGLRSGIARDVSVGFYGGQYRCSICDRDMLRDWECRHWPGRDYPKLDSKGNPIEGETVRAVAWIHDARLAEVSAVYDGATPGAMVQKARSLAAAGEIKPETLTWLERRYRVRLPAPGRAYPGADIPPPTQEVATVDWTPEQVAAIRLALCSAGQAPDADPVAAAQAVSEQARAAQANAAEVELLKPYEARVAELAPLADMGRQYRADLVEAALVEGARAYGPDFATETYRGLLEAAGTSIEVIKRFTDDWRAVGDKQFPAGRATQDPAAPAATTRQRRPAAAFS